MFIVQSSLHIMESTRLWKTFVLADIQIRSYNIKYAKDNKKRLTLFLKNVIYLFLNFYYIFMKKSVVFLMGIRIGIRMGIKIDLHNSFLVAYKWCLQSILFLQNILVCFLDYPLSILMTVILFFQFHIIIFKFIWSIWI